MRRPPVVFAGAGGPESSLFVCSSVGFRVDLFDAVAVGVHVPVDGGEFGRVDAGEGVGVGVGGRGSGLLHEDGLITRTAYAEVPPTRGIRPRPPRPRPAHDRQTTDRLGHRPPRRDPHPPRHRDHHAPALNPDATLCIRTHSAPLRDEPPHSAPPGTTHLSAARHSVAELLPSSLAGRSTEQIWPTGEQELADFKELHQR